MKRLLNFLAIVVAATSFVRADQFVTGQAASSVLGQTDFVSNVTGTFPNRFHNPSTPTVDPTTGKVFVADIFNNRILRFSSTAALSNGSFPEAVIGQPNFSSFSSNQGGAAGPNTLAFVYQITVDRNGRLWVADSSNNRVLCFVAASFLANNPPADYVFGQPNFTTVSAGSTVAKMNYPGGVAVGSDDTLWVADAESNRVLRFANISTKSSGANANGVLGQANFIDNGFSSGATGMHLPMSVSVDSAGRLWVVDSSNSRVLRFDNAAALGNGAPASTVLGQQNFTDSSFGTTATSFNTPYGVLAGPDGTVFVGDYTNGRVMGFRNAAGKTNGAAADFVLGKPNFTSTAAGPTATLLSGPVNLSLSPSGHLFVADYNANRIVRFVPVKSPTVTIQTRKATTSSATFRIKGKASGEVTKVTYRLGKRGAFKTARGTGNWKFKAKLRSGKNLITVIAEGPGGSSAAKKVTVTKR